MCFKKKEKEKKIVKLSDKTINFIAKYMIKELSISSPINKDVLDDIYYRCIDYDDKLAMREEGMVLEPVEEEKCLMASDVEGELFIAIEKNNIDFDDLNNRLGLK